MRLRIIHEDLEDFLIKIEDSFNIRFTKNELSHVSTFGELCDAIKAKINFLHSDDCTTQQAFYKIRKALYDTNLANFQDITPATKLEKIFPRKSRKQKLKILENNLGFNISILRPPHYIVFALLLLLLASFITLFIDWILGLAGLGLSSACFWIVYKLGNVIEVETISQLTEKVTREHYNISRRNSLTVNMNEIDKILEDWFIEHFALKKADLSRESYLF